MLQSNAEPTSPRSMRAFAKSGLQLVLSYLNELDLPHVARTSSTWYRAVDSPLVWKQLLSAAPALRMYMGGEWAAPHMLQTVFTSCTRVSELTYIHVRGSLYLSALTLAPASLHTLTIGQAEESVLDANSWRILARMPHLTNLSAR